jgi:hypothetical protein
MENIETNLSGTAWLSSVRVVKCNIKLLNERNLSYIFYKKNFLKVQILVILICLKRAFMGYSITKQVYTS